MSIINTNVNHYHDFSSLQQMRFDAQNNSKDSLIGAAKQLEGVFLNMVLKSMRDANNSFKSELFSSSSTDFYREMHDQQLALTLADKGSIGLSNILVKQLSPVASSESSSLNAHAIDNYIATENG